MFLVTFGTLAFEPITVLLSHSMLLMIVYGIWVEELSLEEVLVLCEVEFKVVGN